MSMDISDTTTDLQSNINEKESMQCKDGKITSTENMDFRRDETYITTPPLGAEIFIKSKKEEETDWEALLDTETTTKPKSKKTRLTVKEYMSSQKLYDVLKDPENSLPIKTSLSLKTVNMKSKNKRSLIPFSSFINVTVNEQRATNITGVLGAKPTVTVKISPDDSIAAPSTTTLVDERTSTTIPTISPTTPNSTKLRKDAKSSVEMPYKSDRSNLEPPKTITTTDETKSSTRNTTSPVSMAITTTINENSTTNIAPTVTTSTNSTKYIANNGNNNTNLSTTHKKSVKPSVHIPLSIASKAHKSLVLKGLKLPIHPLSKSRNCVLLSTTSGNTDTSKGIIKFIPRNSCPAKCVSDKNNDANTSDSNSNEAFSGKEVLVITTDVNTKKTAVNKVPLVGKRKYTDPSSMPPILSFSYQKSLADYIRKAKEFHKRAKLCSTIIDYSNTNEKEHQENMISIDIESINTQDRIGNYDNTNKECDNESNVAQGKGNGSQPKVVTEISEEIGKLKCRGSIEDKSNGIETAEGIDNVKRMESTVSIGNLKVLESAEDAEKGVKSTACIDNLKYVKSTEGTKNLKDIENTKSTGHPNVVKSAEDTKNSEFIKSNENIDSLKDVESTEGTKTLKDIEYVESTENLTESPGDTDSHRDMDSAEVIKDVKDIDSAYEGTDNLKSAESTKGTKNLEDNESSENTDSQSEIESVDSVKDVKDVDEGKPEHANNLNNIEPIEDTNYLKYLEPTDGTENMDDMKSAEDADIPENMTTTADMGNQIDIESDLFTYEIFNNVSGISNATSRNEHTQTKDSTIKILKNIFELKEKVQQQAEEIMSLKAAMKLLNTPNILNKR